MPTPAIIHRPPAHPDSLWTLGDHVTFLLSPSHTRNRFSLALITTYPNGGPPPHLHRNEDEMFIVLDGQMTFQLDDTLFHAIPGDALYLPANHIHQYKNASNTPARFLAFAIPTPARLAHFSEHAGERPGQPTDHSQGEQGGTPTPSPRFFEDFLRSIGDPCTDPSTPPPVTPDAIDRLMTQLPLYGIEMHPHATTTKSATCPACPTWSVLGERVTIRLRASDTQGHFTLADITSPPNGGPPPHAHRREDELFHVLHGAYEFLRGDQTLILDKGATLYVPSGTVHAYKNISPTPSRLLDLHTPAGFEAFFEELGSPLTENSPPPPPRPLERILEVILKHGMTLPPPRPQ